MPTTTLLLALAMANAPSDPRVDAVFAALGQPDAPGCAVGVYESGRLLHARGYGLADVERGVALTPGSVLDVGSLSKQFTAFAVHLLATDGKLGLDDSVRRFVPELPEYAQAVTVRHLLHHEGGLRDYLTILDLAGFKDEDWTTAEDALLAIARQRAPDRPPGDLYSYSNTGYFLLSVVVERASGRSLRDFAQERIFTPLRMAHTQFNDRHDRIVPGRALAYVEKDGELRLALSDFEQTGDGSLLTTVEDWLLWDRNLDDAAVGGPAVKAAMIEPGRLNNGKPNTYASGLRLGSYRGLPTVRHSGSWAGYHAASLRFPAQKLSVTCLCNVASERVDPWSLVEKVGEALLGDRMQPPAAPPAPEPSPKPRKALALPVEQLAPFAGTYESAEVGGIPPEIVVRDGALFVRHRTLTGSLEPQGGDVFLRGDATLRFFRNGGAVAGFLLDTGSIKGLRYLRSPGGAKIM